MKRVKRRLSAIMCADVAQYSKLMERDEDGTLDRLKACRSVMSALTERHNGRIVNTWGDAVIIEFVSVIEAVQCAVDIQNELSQRNSDLPDGDRMDFRIGINLGDIMVEGDDIYGDGVNVAARLQQIAKKGGIMLSQSVFEQVKNKVALGFDPQGPQHVKNVSEPVETYSVRLGGRNAPEAPLSSGPLEEAGPASDGPPPHRGWDPDARAAANGFEQARRWIRSQPRRVRRSVFMIGVFFILNLLTSGLSNLWFVWPSLPFGVFLLWHLFVGKKDEGSAETDPKQG